jgi:hypothetical protein
VRAGRHLEPILSELGSCAPFGAMNVLRVALGICIAALFGGSACTSDSDAVREACSGGNLLELHTAMDSYGVIREQRLTDGAVPSPAGPINDYVAAIFFGPGAHVTFDLGVPKRIAALQVVSDNDDSQLVSVSLDGAAFEPVPLSAAGGQGLRTRHARDLDIAARFVRLAPTSLARGRVVAEVAAFCSIPDPFPVTLVQRGNYQEDVDALLLRAKVIGLSKVLLVVAAIALILWLPLSNSRHRTLLAVGFVCVGFLGWLRFGDLVGGGGMVHAWDGMHYYLGSKYFDELRYAELYRCIALHERQRGRGFMVDRERVRDLDTNREYPGSWASTKAGACRAHFSPERWSEFGRDVDLLRRDFQYRHFHKALNDHGYNATPPHTTWVQVLSSAVAPTRSGLAWLACWMHSPSLSPWVPCGGASDRCPRRSLP